MRSHSFKWEQWVKRMNTKNTSIFSSLTSSYCFSDTGDSPFINAVPTIFQFHPFLSKEIPQNSEKVFSSSQTALKARITLITSIYSKAFKKKYRQIAWLLSVSNSTDTAFRLFVRTGSTFGSPRNPKGYKCPKASSLGVTCLLRNHKGWKRSSSSSPTINPSPPGLLNKSLNATSTPCGTWVVTVLPLGWQCELVPTRLHKEESTKSGNSYINEENLITHCISLPLDCLRPATRMYLSNISHWT